MARPASHTRTFQRKETAARALTHERIADDLQAFLDGGGRIERLGVTRSLTRIEAAGAGAAGDAPSATGARRK